MTITTSQIHKVLQTYGRQVRKGDRIRQEKLADQNTKEHTVKLSPEAKRNQVIDRVSTEIINRLINGDYKDGSIEAQVMDSLQKEYDKPLKISQDTQTGMPLFHVVDNEKGEITSTLESEEAGHVLQTLVDLTRNAVDKTML